MSRLRTNPEFLRLQVIDGDPRDALHPVVLHLQTWMRLFWRAKEWTHAISAASFSPPAATGEFSGFFFPPDDELDLAYIHGNEIPGIGYSAWQADFTNSDPPNSSFAQFFLHTSVDPTDGSTQIAPVRLGGGDVLHRHALSLYYSLQLEVEGVGTTTLTSLPATGPYVTDLLIDQGRSNTLLPLYGTDPIGVTVSVSPSSPAGYWTYDGIYDPATGIKRSGQSVFSNTFLP